MIHRSNLQLKGKMPSPGQSQPLKGGARRTRQKEQLRGLDISGPLEPAHGLYNLCAQMIERNEVSYISPTKCLSRQQNLTVARWRKSSVLMHQGQV